MNLPTPVMPTHSVNIHHNSFEAVTASECDDLNVQPEQELAIR
jgi:hypothetical protein